MVKVKCSYCGGIVEKRECDIKHNKKSFCNMECKNKWFKEYCKISENCPNYKHGMSKGVNKFRCLYCGKEQFRRRDYQKYCNPSCQLKYEYKMGTRDKKKITEKAHQKTREMVKKGTHSFQRPDIHIKSNQSLGRRNYGKTWIEEKIGWRNDKKWAN